MSKAKKTNLLMQEVINKNISISKRFKSKVEATAILSEFESRATSDLRNMISQSKLRAERMRIGNYLSTVIDNSKGQFNKISSSILSDSLYRNKEDFTSLAEILKRVTERESISEARVIMNEIYKALSPKLEYKLANSVEDNSRPKAFSPKILISNKNFFLKELENDKRKLNKRIEKYLDAANSLDDKTCKYLPNINIQNNIKMLEFNRKDVVVVKVINRDADLFNMRALKRYTKQGMRVRKENNNSNEDNKRKSIILNDNNAYSISNNSNDGCNTNLKRYYGNTISLVKKEAYDNLFFKSKMIKKSQSADQLIELQLPEINEYDNLAKQRISLLKEKQSSINNNTDKNEKDNRKDNAFGKDKAKLPLQNSREALKPKLYYDMRLFDEFNKGITETKIDFDSKDFRAKSRAISKYCDIYSNNTSMNKYLADAAKYLGNKIYSKREMNNHLDQFYARIKPMQLKIPIGKSEIKNLNVDIKSNNIITTLATKKDTHTNYKYDKPFQSEYDETTENC